MFLRKNRKSPERQGVNSRSVVRTSNQQSPSDRRNAIGTFSYFKRCILFMAIIFLYQFMTSSFFFPDDKRASFAEQTTESMNADVHDYSTFSRAPNCTHEQLMKVRHQLPPESCLDSSNAPWTQRCSLTVATKCPKATWLDYYYLELQKRLSHPSNSSSPGGGVRRTMSNSSQEPPPSSFLGISIGCNKGFDAINTLRMGTFDDSIDKKAWKSAMEQDGEELHQSVCNQDNHDDMFEVSKYFQQSSSSLPLTSPRPQGEMHCVEPMPQTYQRLNHSAEILGYTQKGLKVTHAAVSKESGQMLFHTDGMKKGVENKGLDNNCRKMSKKNQKLFCQHIPVYSLKDFVDTHVKTDKANPINILSIDVEGFDGDVLLGATTNVLRRVEYLEFEYNWMGSWKNQHLFDIINMLDEDSDMTCYWAGVDRLWRITNCWMSYFDVHAWSNVACVNRRLVPSLATKMEEIFQRTLDDKQQWIKGQSLKETQRRKRGKKRKKFRPRANVYES